MEKNSSQNDVKHVQRQEKKGGEGRTDGSVCRYQGDYPGGISER